MSGTLKWQMTDEEGIDLDAPIPYVVNDEPVNPPEYGRTIARAINPGAPVEVDEDFFERVGEAASILETAVREARDINTRDPQTAAEWLHQRIEFAQAYLLGEVSK